MRTLSVKEKKRSLKKALSLSPPREETAGWNLKHFRYVAQFLFHPSVEAFDPVHVEVAVFWLENYMKFTVIL